MSKQDLLDQVPEGWEQRRLCPDGACLGVIGESGMCSECGQIPSGEELDPRLRGLRDEAVVEAEVAEHRVATSTPEAPGDWDQRELCPDGGCIGLIGPNGRCSECGTTITPS